MFNDKTLQLLLRVPLPKRYPFHCPNLESFLVNEIYNDRILILGTRVVSVSTVTKSPGR